MSERLPAPIEPLPANATLPEIIRYEIATGRVEPHTVQQMLELQIAWEKREAEKEHYAAKARLKFPSIPKKKKGATSYYAAWDSVQEIIDPILEREGFTLSFTSGEPNEKGQIPITGKLAHKLGHFEIGTVYQPIAAVSKGMNANQAMGAAVSYGERYCAQMMLNLRFVGMDNNADSLAFLNEQELMQIEDLLHECALGEPAMKAFLDFVGAEKVTAIYRGAFISAQSYLRKILEKRRMSKAE